MDKFYAHYPQFKNYPLPDKQFSWLGYYAMQQMGDDDARQHSLEMKEKLWMRNKASNQIALFIPTLHTQLQLNKLTQAGLDNHLKFLDNTEKFHEKMRLYFYPKIFGEAAVNNEDWWRFKVEYYAERLQIDWLKMLMPLLLISIFLGMQSVFNFRKDTAIHK